MTLPPTARQQLQRLLPARARSVQHPRAGQGAGLRPERERAMEATALVLQQQVERQLFIFECFFCFSLSLAYSVLWVLVLYRAVRS